MKNLVIVRHGHYTNDRLSTLGKRQMKLLADELSSQAAGSSCLILSSVATRATDCAEILAAVLEAPWEKHRVLWSENDHPEDLEAAMALVRSNQERSETLILVTHFEYALHFPRYFLEQQGLDFKSAQLEKGEALWIDCASGSTVRMGKSDVRMLAEQLGS